MNPVSTITISGHTLCDRRNNLTCSAYFCRKSKMVVVKMEGDAKNAEQENAGQEISGKRGGLENAGLE
jgi:hypothetical protein